MSVIDISRVRRELFRNPRCWGPAAGDPLTDDGQNLPGDIPGIGIFSHQISGKRLSGRRIFM